MTRATADRRAQAPAVGAPDSAATAPQTRSISSSVRGGRATLLSALAVAAFLAVWQIVGSGINPILMATPTAVAGALVELTVDGPLVEAFITAMQALLVGFVLAAAVGIALGVAMGRSPTVYRIMTPFVSFFQATPTIALLPLVVIWFGIDVGAEIAIVMIVVIWTVIVNTAEGVRNTPATLLDMARLYQVGERATVWGVAIPYSLPYIFAGLKIGIARALVGIIVAEMFVSLNGLGGLVARYGDSFRTAELIATIVTTSVVGVLCVAVIESLRKYVAPWAYR